MHPTSKDARIAGAWYVSMIFTAPFCLLYVPNKLIVRGNPAATADNILRHETLLRAGIVCELLLAITSIFLVMALYRLLSGVNKSHAALMVILGAVVSAPIAFLNVVNELAALILLRSPEFLAAFDLRQLQTISMLFVRLHGQGLLVEQIFWGLWLLPFGWLVIRSRFIPWILGALLLVNGLTYVFLSATSLLNLAQISVLNKWAFIPETGELWIMLWLLIRGVKVQQPPPLAAATLTP